VLWALGRADLAREFDRVMVFDHGHLIEEGPFVELAKNGATLPKLLVH